MLIQNPGIVPIILAQSGVAVVSASNTDEQALATITIPANALGANGRVAILASFTTNNNANAKTSRIRFGGIGGTIYFTRDMASNVSQAISTRISNRGVTNSQVGGVPANSSTGFGISTSALVTSSVDTSAETTIVITGQKATAGDTLILESYQVIIYPKA